MWFRPIIERVIEGAKTAPWFPPFLMLLCDFRAMNSDANAISWGRDAPLLQHRKNSVPSSRNKSVS